MADEHDENEGVEEANIEQESMTGDGKRRPFKRANVREKRSYFDGEGREVVELVPMFGKEREPSEFRGITTIIVKTSTPNGMPIPPQKMEFNFGIDATSLRQAFEKFDDTADKRLVEWKREQEEMQRESRRIVGARSVPRMLGPDGKPVR